MAKSISGEYLTIHSGRLSAHISPSDRLMFHTMWDLCQRFVTISNLFHIAKQVSYHFPSPYIFMIVGRHCEIHLKPGWNSARSTAPSSPSRPGSQAHRLQCLHRGTDGSRGSRCVCWHFSLLIIYIWLVVEPCPSEKYESQLGWLFSMHGTIKNVTNHQPAICYHRLLWQNKTFILRKYLWDMFHCNAEQNKEDGQN